MKSQLKIAAMVALMSPLATGCATKGWVQARLDTNRKIADSSLAGERVARMAGDSSVRADLKQDIAMFRKDLDSLRTEFGAKITSIQQGMVAMVQFDFPVNFAYNDATIREQDKATLNRFAGVACKYYQGSAITVEGFADPAGGVKFNQRLSQQRADNVKAYLTSACLGAGSDIKSVGYGKTRLVVAGAEKDQPGAEKNRRVVFVIESKGDNVSTNAVTLNSQQ
ncbi:MAG: OmpA family protein [Gemmatimonadota bacterium]|nr:OmpA family protein [Gemmatimonadota bacterium]